jgi:hypothetical protein
VGTATEARDGSVQGQGQGTFDKQGDVSLYATCYVSGIIQRTRTSAALVCSSVLGLLPSPPRSRSQRGARGRFYWAGGWRCVLRAIIKQYLKQHGACYMRPICSDLYTICYSQKSIYICVRRTRIKNSCKN